MRRRSPGTTSVVITNHNYGAFVTESIESALAQDGDPVEVIVVDDGSTDESPEILDRYADRVTVIRQPNQGQAAAWNAGFAAACGDVVIFLDADDRLLPGVADRCRRSFERQPRAARVHYPLRCIDRAGRPTGGHLPADPGALPSGDLSARVLSQPDDIRWQPTSGNAYPAEILDRVMPVPPEPYRISADHYLLNVTSLLGPVVALGQPGGEYRVHGGNADFRDDFDLGRARETIVRTVATHREIHRLAYAEHLGFFPSDPLAVASTSFLASRLASLRLDRARHPLAGDRITRLCVEGVVASSRRRDLPARLRLAWALWFVATSCAPRATVARLAGAALRPPTRPRPAGRHRPATDHRPPGSGRRWRGGRLSSGRRAR